MYIFVFLLLISVAQASQVLKRSGNVKSIVALKSELMSLVSPLQYGAKASKQEEAAVLAIVNSLSLLRAPKKAADTFADKGSSKRLLGRWNLQYTNAPDVVNIGKIPGVNLDFVGQEVSLDQTITNIVKASGFLADTTQYVTVNAVQKGSNEVDLQFAGTKIVFDRIFGQDKILGKAVGDVIKPLEITFRPKDVESIKNQNGGENPSFEIIYLDDTLRIQRTNRGYIFVIARETPAGRSSSGSGIELGPWLKQRLGDTGMKALGVVSVIPYALFFYKYLQSL